ncbi:MAG: hypothetical protein ABL908_16085, partial [Hyphomicrobium sp.]
MKIFICLEPRGRFSRSFLVGLAALAVSACSSGPSLDADARERQQQAFQKLHEDGLAAQNRFNAEGGVAGMQAKLEVNNKRHSEAFETLFRGPTRAEQEQIAPTLKEWLVFAMSARCAGYDAALRTPALVKIAKSITRPLTEDEQRRSDAMAKQLAPLWNANKYDAAQRGFQSGCDLRDRIDVMPSLEPGFAVGAGGRVAVSLGAIKEFSREALRQEGLYPGGIGTLFATRERPGRPFNPHAVTTTQDFVLTKEERALMALGESLMFAILHEAVHLDLRHHEAINTAPQADRCARLVDSEYEADAHAIKTLVKNASAQNELVGAVSRGAIVSAGG